MSGYELVMPFVTTTENGGPHDSASYVAGWEMGTLDRDLSIAAHLGALPGLKQIHTVNRPQADLIAMKHGYEMTVEEYPDAPDYLELSFLPVSRELDGDDR